MPIFRQGFFANTVTLPTPTAGTSASLFWNLPIALGTLLLARYIWAQQYPLQPATWRVAARWRRQLEQFVGEDLIARGKDAAQHAIGDATATISIIRGGREGGRAGGAAAAKPHDSWRRHVRSAVVEHAWDTLCGSLVQEVGRGVACSLMTTHAHHLNCCTWNVPESTDQYRCPVSSPSMPSPYT